MAPPLRIISAHVEEPRQGKFEWVLLERDEEGAWFELERTQSPAATYKTAMANGLVALERLSDNLDLGPRKEHSRSERMHANDADRPIDRETPSGRKANGGMFGFGPVK